MDILNPKIESYIASLAKVDDPILTEMEERAARRDFPIVGPQAGRLLEMLARFAQAKRIPDSATPPTGLPGASRRAGSSIARTFPRPTVTFRP